MHDRSDEIRWRVAQAEWPDDMAGCWTCLANAGLRPRSALSPESNPEGQ